MPPRIPIFSAFRQGLFSMKTPSAPLSTTAAPKALRDLRNSTSSMLNIDSGSGSGTQGPNTGSTEMVGQIYRNLQGPRPRRTDSGSSADAPNSLGAGLSGGSGRQNVEDDLRNSIRHDDYMRQLPRWWRPGDVYAPHDLSSSEMGKWRKSTARRKDVIDLLGLRPLDMYRNFSVISEFTTPHGRIRRPVETGLRPVNQRKMAKAIRRSIGLGLSPSVHHHPELLARLNSRVLAQSVSAQSKGVRWS